MVKIIDLKTMQNITQYKENRNIFFKVKYFSNDDFYENIFARKNIHSLFFAIMDENEKEILALSKIQTSEIENNYFISFISTVPGYDGNGFAKRMIESIHEWGRENKKSITPSSFTSKGQRLKKYFLKMKEKYPEVCQWTNLNDLGFQSFEWKYLKSDLKNHLDKNFEKILLKLDIENKNFEELQDFVLCAYTKLKKKELNNLCCVIGFYGWKPFNPDIRNIKKNICHISKSDPEMKIY